MARRPIIRKSDLTPALEAAKAAGWNQVSVTVEVAGGHHMHITASNAPEISASPVTPLEKWRSGRAS